MPPFSRKGQEARAEREAAHQHDAPPAYEPIDSHPTDIEHSKDKSGKSARPTVDSPFNFPSDITLPSFSEASGSSSQKLIAVPQTTPDPSAPLLRAFPPTLLRYGIPKDTWLSLLDTVSAFLSAKVTDRALRHAVTMGQHMSETPKDVFKGVYNHVKDTGKSIGNNAKRGNIIGAAFNLVGGAISIPIHAAMGTARTAVGLPMSAVQAATKRPETPRERANAYFRVANNDWLNKRGLHASLLDSQELSQLLAVSVVEKTELRENQEENAEVKLRGLEAYIAAMEVEMPATLSVGPNSLWVVLTHVEPTRS
ncbi:hypothetical protein BGZ63DRAFT_395321 [Mariannaea sp. PMI_226]|nr:hypothetical protein BGZ63DRAFT_395321 [Mariannaea sp. PMI_226]